jgi:hypothetical protein
LLDIGKSAVSVKALISICPAKIRGMAIMNRPFRALQPFWCYFQESKIRLDFFF